jgi:hypothetical protein
MVKMDGFVEILIGAGVFIGLSCWGIFSLIDYFFIFDGIKSKTPIKPKIELVIKDNKVDTLYVYEIK